MEVERALHSLLLFWRYKLGSAEWRSPAPELATDLRFAAPGAPPPDEARRRRLPEPEMTAGWRLADPKSSQDWR